MKKGVKVNVGVPRVGSSGASNVASLWKQVFRFLRKSGYVAKSLMLVLVSSHSGCKPVA